MKRKIVVVLLCVFMLTLLGPATLWADSDDKKIKNFIPPGHLKNGKFLKGELPPPFQNMISEWQGEIEGRIVYKTTIGNNDWIVVKSDDILKSLILNSTNKYSVGDWVEVEYFFNRVLEIERDKDKDDDEDEDDDRYEYLLSYGLSISPTKVYEDEEVTFRLEVKNNTNKNIATRFNSGQRYDFVVKKDGKKVWRWSDDYSFITVMQNLTIEPGERETYTADWVCEESGDYTVEAYFMGKSTTKPVLVKEFTVREKAQTKNLQYKLEVVKGDPNLFILMVTNPLDKAINVTTPSGQIYDFRLTKNGQKIWQWSDGKNFTQAMQNVKFAAKETKLYYAQYKTTSKGEYKLYGYFKGDGSRTVGPKAFTVQ